MTPSKESFDRSARAAVREFMLSIFREAIPEIDPEAELVFVDSNPLYLPAGDPLDPSKSSPEPIYLRRYHIPGPYPVYYAFSIAYLPDVKRVLVLEISDEWKTEGSPDEECYIVMYSKRFGFPGRAPCTCFMKDSELASSIGWHHEESCSMYDPKQ